MKPPSTSLESIDAPDASMTSSPRPLRALYVELGRALTAADRNEEAIAAFEHALGEPGASPRKAQIAALLASTRAGFGDLDGALDAALQTLLDGGEPDLRPLLDQARSLMPRIRLRAHRALLCDPRWSTVVADSPMPDRDRAEIGVLVGRALVDLGEEQAAEPVLSAATALIPTEPEVHHLRGRVLERLGRHDEAVRAFDQAHERALGRADSDLAEVTAVARAGALLGANEIERALSSLPDPLPADPGLRTEALLVRATGLLRQGSAEEARQTAAEAAGLFDDGIRAQLIQGHALIVLHRDREAVEAIDRALDRDPAREDIQLLRWVAQVEGQLDTRQAEKLRRQIRDMAPGTIRACLDDPVWQARKDDGRAHYARAELFRAIGEFSSVVVECHRALELGLGYDLPPEPNAPVHALLARALEKAGDLDGAAEHRSQAGIDFYYRNEWSLAIRHLQAAVTHKPTHPDASWFLASALDAQAASLLEAVEPGAGDRGSSTPREELLLRARNVWDQAARTLDEIPAWAFGVRALISEASIPLAPAQREELLWAGVGFAERGLVKDRRNSFLWTVLGRIYRLLRLNSSALAAFDTAMEISPSDHGALQETIILCGNIGDYDRTCSAVERRETMIDDGVLTETELRQGRAWNLGIRAILAEAAGDYSDALRLAIESIQTDVVAQTWIKQVAGRAYRMVGERKESLRIFRELLALADTGDPDREGEIAEAHFGLGHPDEAIEGLARWQAATGRPHHDIEPTAGLCRLLRGEIDAGERAIGEWIADHANADGPRGLRFGLRVVDDELGEGDARDRARAAGQRLMGRLESALAERPPGPDPDGELAAVIEDAGAARTARVGAIAGRARRARERDDWDAAGQWYSRLCDMRDLFPEVTDALTDMSVALEQEAKRILDERGPSAAAEALDSAVAIATRAGLPPARIAAMHQALADAMVHTASTAPAVAQYEAVLDLTPDTEAAVRTALSTRIAIAHDLGGGSDESRRRFGELVDDYARLGEKAPGETIGMLAASLVGSTRTYAALDSAWARVADDPSLNDYERRALVAARTALAGALDDLLDGVEMTEELIPFVTPLVLEIGDALIPLVSDAHDGGAFLFKLVPAMRDRIRIATGVVVPGVRARGALDLQPDQFSIEVDETPVLKGSLEPADTFTVSRGARPDAQVSDFHPLTGEAAVWSISPAGEEPADLTAPNLLIHQIERVFRDYLERYLGPEEVEGLALEWSTEDSELVDSVLPDAAARLRLTWVLQALVADGVSIADWQAILKAVSETGGIGAPTTVLHRAVRRRLRDALPGPRAGLIPVAIPDELEASLLDEEATGRRLELRHWLRQTVLMHGPALALIASTDDARERIDPFARADHPLIRTLTREELREATVEHAPAAREGGAV